MGGEVFLSCLCGSDPQKGVRFRAPDFLSCLCGSELMGAHPLSLDNFLSCLCGSERGVGQQARLQLVSELPMRQ